MKLKAVLLKKMVGVDIAYLRKSLEENYDIETPSDSSEECLLELIRNADVVIGRELTENLIENANNLSSPRVLVLTPLIFHYFETAIFVCVLHILMHHTSQSML